MLGLFAGVVESVDQPLGNGGADIEVKVSKGSRTLAESLNRIAARKSFRNNRIGYSLSDLSQA